MKNDESNEVSPVWPTILCLWALLALFTLYDPASVRDQAQKSEFLANQEWLNKSFRGMADLNETIGLAALNGGLNKIRSVINEPYILFAESSSASPSPVVSSQSKDAGVSSTDAGTKLEAVSFVHETAKPKQRILVVGASSIQFAIGTELERRLPKYDGVKVRRYGKLASGLVRPDFYDWPKQIRKLVKQFKPDLMIANFGGNGAQAIPLAKYKEAKFKTEAWNKEYTKRVHAVIDIAQSAGADVAFIGMPNMRSKKFSRKMQHLNKIQKKAAEEKGAVWISTWAWTSDKKGQYRKSIKLGKKRGLMRTSDGIHYSRLGARVVINNFMKALEPRYSLSMPDSVRTRRHVLTNTRAKSSLEYTEYQPPAEQGTAPYLVVSSTAAAGDACPEPGHSQLKSAVRELNIGVVALPPCGFDFDEDLTTEDLVSQLKSHLNRASDFQFLPVLGSTQTPDWTSLNESMKALSPKTSTTSPNSP